MTTKENNPMAGTWTRATKAIRRLKGGRPLRNVGNDRLTPLQAVCRLFAEVEKAYVVLKDELVETDDLTWALQYYLPATSSHPAYIGHREQKSGTIRLETSTKDAIQLLEELKDLPGAVFLGIEWSLTDREDVNTESGWIDDPNNKGLPTTMHWQTPFNSYMHMRADAVTEALNNSK